MVNCIDHTKVQESCAVILKNEDQTKAVDYDCIDGLVIVISFSTNTKEPKPSNSFSYLVFCLDSQHEEKATVRTAEKEDEHEDLVGVCPRSTVLEVLSAIKKENLLGTRAIDCPPSVNKDYAAI